MLDVELDGDGYLVNLDDWNRDVAVRLASSVGIVMTEAHWEVIDLLREFYRDFEHVPSQRPLVRFLSERLGKDKGSSIYLMRLFTGSPASVAARIAGLPRPTNCF